MNNIPQRIKQYADVTGHSVRNIEITIGASNSTISRAIRDNKDIGSNWIEKIISNYSDINPNWLVTGKGDMFLDEKYNLKYNPNYNLNEKMTPNLKKEGVGIPLIPIEAMAGLGNGDTSVLPHDIEQVYYIPEFTGRVDFYIRVNGSSMYPKYSSGDVLGCKRVYPSVDFMQWNKPYVLDTSQGPIVKRVLEAENKDSFICRSDNKAYSDIILKRKEIRAMAIVIGVIRFE